MKVEYKYEETGGQPSPDNLATQGKLSKREKKSTKVIKKIDLSTVIEFFDPIVKKKALSKKKMSVKKKDKGST